MYYKYSDLIHKAINRFNNDSDCISLIKCDVSERDLCAQLMCILKEEIKQTEFSDYSVNIEYNRGMDGDLKKSKTIDGKLAVLDLIIHKIIPDQEIGFNNLICIEMKKEKRPATEIQEDKDRLATLTDISKGFCYKAGFMLLVCQDINSDRFGLYIESEYELH